MNHLTPPRTVTIITSRVPRWDRSDLFEAQVWCLCCCPNDPAGIPLVRAQGLTPAQAREHAREELREMPAGDPLFWAPKGGNA